MDTIRLPLKKLGKTGLLVSPLGLAAFTPWAVSRSRENGLPPEEVERAFYEYGINTFLVHSSIMPGLAEGIRRLIKNGRRKDLTIIGEASFPFSLLVQQALQKQCRALGTDYLDVWLLGWVRRRWYLTGQTWPAMRRLKQLGQVRAIGFSCHDRKLAAQLTREFNIDVLMIRYNAAHRGAEQEIFEELKDNRPGIISYTATRWGMLLQPLPKMGFPQPMSAPECYRFALSHPAVDLALCAARTPKEIKEDVLGVIEGPLDPARLEECRRFGDAVHQAARGGYRWMFS